MRAFGGFRNWICFHIARRLPNRLLYWTIIHTNTEVWAEKGNVTPDEITWTMLCEHFSIDAKQGKGEGSV
jgi:hypothetical protein